jgi:hypothetical protein
MKFELHFVKDNKFVTENTIIVAEVWHYTQHEQRIWELQLPQSPVSFLRNVQKVYSLTLIKKVNTPTILYFSYSDYDNRDRQRNGWVEIAAVREVQDFPSFNET